MKRLDGLAGAQAPPTGSQRFGDLVVAATGTEGSDPDGVWIGRVGDGWAGWSGWSGQPAGGVRPCRPAVAPGAGGLLEIVVIGQDGAVWHAGQDSSGAGWSDWQSLGQPGGKPVVITKLGARPPDPAPVLIHYVDQSLEIFVVGNDLTVWHIRQLQPGGAWSGWDSLGLPGGPNAGTVGPLVAGTNADGTLALFTTDGTDTVQYCTQLQAGGADWSGWEPLGSPAGHTASPGLAVVQNSNGELELFMVDDSGTLLHRWQLQPGGGWSGWKSLGQPRLGSEVFEVDDITVAADGSGGLVVFATSSAPGSAPGLWFRTQGRAAEPWGDWQEFPLNSGSATALPVEGPVLTQRGTQLVLLVRETGTANMYVVRQMDPDPGILTSWNYDYAKA
jgi:hypothetical protein